MGELDPIPCENDFPLRIRFEAGFEIRNLSMRLFRCKGGTLPETKIAPENRPSQKETSIPTINWCHVSFREVKFTFDLRIPVFSFFFLVHVM